MSAASVLRFEVRLVRETCIQCGIEFAFAEARWQRMKELHEYFYCPNGHQQGYQDKTEADKLREQLLSEQKRTRIAAQERDAARAERDRLQRRVKRGVCPCCNRSFTALSRHMATKHPNYPAQTIHP